MPGADYAVGSRAEREIEGEMVAEDAERRCLGGDVSNLRINLRTLSKCPKREEGMDERGSNGIRQYRPNFEGKSGK
jgi:hypothetical protein